LGSNSRIPGQIPAQHHKGRRISGSKNLPGFRAITRADYVIAALGKQLLHMSEAGGVRLS